jgi:SPP1 gp7 family putative phage head morphogenesis protein
VFTYSEKFIQALFKGVYSKKITPRFLPESLYYAIADYLKKGVYEGYGTTLSSLKATKMPAGFSTQDKELLTELRTNIYLFSAAKTYQQVREMSSALIGDDGRILPFNQFRDKADQTYNLYNKVWLQTEYDTAIGQAQAARKWAEIEKNADVLPLLKYSAVLDSRTSEICKPLDGIIAPVKDPIWKKVAPLNHFNCRCLLLPIAEGKQTSAKVKQSKVDETEGMMQDLFKMNPGIDGYVFSKEHPYFDVAPKDKALAKRNFDLDIPKND